jgi:hypothetical protein
MENIVPNSYPLPSYAVSAWVAGDDLYIAFPGTVSEQGHTIKLPASAGGLAAAVKILRERQAAESLRIGERGTPTQYEIEAGKAWGAVTRRNRKERAEKVEAENKRKLEEHTARVRRAERERNAATELLKELGL